ncbi:uncharacterized protein [Procambarus clarkii]|uniref:uncharacterized protein n=1 Tax=Procambarus clarkii TaxID=6728 RepID=UPI001E670A37|nr:uncharacterized protein LOC123757226 [Procambarus clarkii]
MLSTRPATSEGAPRVSYSDNMIPAGPRCLKMLLLLPVLMTMALRAAAEPRTCFVDVILTTTSGKVTKDVPDFTVKGIPWATCQTARRDCPAGLLGHAKKLFGDNLIPITGNTSVKLCELFGMDLPPSVSGEVHAHYIASGCDKEGSTYLGKLCCWKCIVGPYTFFHPNDNCAASTRPPWCP